MWEFQKEDFGLWAKMIYVLSKKIFQNPWSYGIRSF